MKRETPKMTWKKVKDHTLAEYDITYEWNGSRKTRRVWFKDGKPYEYDGFILSAELQYIKEIAEGCNL